MEKKSFNKENVPELFSQLVKVLEREGKTEEIPKLIKDLKKLSAYIQEELKKSKLIKEDNIKAVVRKRISRFR